MEQYFQIIRKSSNIAHGKKQIQNTNNKTEKNNTQNF